MVVVLCAEGFLVSSRAFCALPTVATPLWTLFVVLLMTFERVEDCVDLLMFCQKRSSWLHNFVVGKELLPICPFPAVMSPSVLLWEYTVKYKR